jgi:hypothetical protein
MLPSDEMPDQKIREVLRQDERAHERWYARPAHYIRRAGNWLVGCITNGLTPKGH